MAEFDALTIQAFLPGGNAYHIQREMSPLEYTRNAYRVAFEDGSGGGGGGESDVKVTVLSPSNGSTLGPNDLITIEVEPVSSLIQIVAAYSGVTHPEVVWEGAGPGPKFSETTKTNGATSAIFVIKRDGGWQAAPTLTAYITT